NYYHIIHFDGHGGYGNKASAADGQNRFQAEGLLLFEDDDGKKVEVSAEQLSVLMRDNAVPVMVLNACQSGMLDQKAEDPFASVAASLIKAGVRGVVAMAYSLYVSGAQEFLPAFYSELFAKRDLAQAVRAGRLKMFQQKKRVCIRGRFELDDFLVPVLYQQEEYMLPFAKGAKAKEEIKKAPLPEEAQDTKNPYGFIGRDRAILELERAMRKDTSAILIQGLGGVGKTTLARGFVKWLSDTEGMDGCLWLTFMDIRSAEYVINSLGSAIFGKDFLVADMEQKTDALAKVLKENRLVIVWDNFEVAAGIEGTYIKPNLTTEDLGLLKTFLEKIRG
ncbi:MAG: CHAT domain-containing protein, partial [FCB group bacterium]|nr:CHAT domain-containing protein [FCB group bacterium]